MDRRVALVLSALVAVIAVGTLCVGELPFTWLLP